MSRMSTDPLKTHIKSLELLAIDGPAALTLHVHRKTAISEHFDLDDTGAI